MKQPAGKLVLSLGVVCLLATALRAETPAPGTPYGGIISRNIFGLVPIPDPALEQKPPGEPPPKITPSGIMNVFDKVQVLFKVAGKPKAGQPQQDQSYVMTEGERQDEIEVIKINEKDGIVTFDNHGTVQELPLVAAQSPSAPGGAAGGAAGNPGMGSQPSGMMPSGGGMMAPRGAALRNQTNPMPSGGNPSQGGPSSGMNLGGGTNPGGFANSTQPGEQLSPEVQVLLMEKSRLDTQDLVTQGKMPPLPPTAITPSDVLDHGSIGGAPLVGPPAVP